MTEPQYTTEQMLLTNSGLKVTMLYPEEIAEDAPLLGVVAPDISSKYEFKVRVSKAKGQWLWRVLLYERQGDLINYKVIESNERPVFHCWWIDGTADFFQCCPKRFTSQNC